MTTSTGPVVSVVVPCFDVERYVDECLVSLLGQTHERVQIVAVDDGSTDRTADVLAQHASRDRRLDVVTRANGGLGAARNSGIARATGEHLMFVDGDDVVPLDAIERMVSTIERTGSSFVTGVADRFDGERRWRASLYRRGFGDDLDRTHVYERPSLLNDHIVCSKLFRRTFWDEHGFTFPEGTLFEDIQVATRAHCLAASVDVLAEPTYLWRSRPSDDLSITQDRRRPGGVTARFAALGSTDDFIRSTAPPNVWRRHGMKLLTIDVPLYARELDEGDDRYCDEFLTAARPVMASISPETTASVGPMHRVLHRAVLDGDLATAAAVTTLLKSPDRGRRWRALRALDGPARRSIVTGALRRRLGA